LDGEKKPQRRGGRHKISNVLSGEIRGVKKEEALHVDYQGKRENFSKKKQEGRT